jgi:hypothetical protein
MIERHQCDCATGIFDGFTGLHQLDLLYTVGGENGNAASGQCFVAHARSDYRRDRVSNENRVRGSGTNGHMSESPIESPTEDRVEQNLPIADEPDEPDAGDLPVEADATDVIEQRTEVPLDDEYDER